MNILVIGDVVGDLGLEALEQGITKVKEKYNIDCIIANGENAAEGKGLTKQTFEKIKNAGVNVVTLGNHTWAKMDVFKIIGDKQIVRPANLPKNLPGRGYRVYNFNDKKIAVVNLLGMINVGINTENSFNVMEKALQNLNESADIIIVDYHGETTAEKIAFGKYFDGRITAFFGTHTHVQTADETILPNNTAYITDLGMTGSDAGVLGIRKEVAFKRLTTTLPEKYQQELKGPKIFCGAIIEVDENKNGKILTAKNIIRIREYLD